MELETSDGITAMANAHDVVLSVRSRYDEFPGTAVGGDNPRMIMSYRTSVFYSSE